MEPIEVTGFVNKVEGRLLGYMGVEPIWTYVVDVDFPIVGSVTFKVPQECTPIGTVFRLTIDHIKDEDE